MAIIETTPQGGGALYAGSPLSAFGGEVGVVLGHLRPPAPDRNRARPRAHSGDGVPCHPRAQRHAAGLPG
eukprot:2938618-Pyramimonas_sp.AAC.1